MNDFEGSICDHLNQQCILLQATFASGTVSGSSLANQSWETLLPNSQNTVQVGGIVSYSSSITDVTPTSITVAGAQCSILTAG